MKKDLSIDFLGVHCENPFFLSSSPVCNNAEQIAKAFDAGWAGIFYKTVGIEGMNECSPRFDVLSDDPSSWSGFKNMEQISEMSLEQNVEEIKKLKENYPNKVLGISIMGSTEEEWRTLAKAVTEAGADLIELNFSCPQMTSHDMGSDVGQNPQLVSDYTRAVVESTHVPVIAKMTPNVAEMSDTAIAAANSGAKSVSAINTIKSITNIDIDNMTGKPVVNGKSSVSGYSGNAAKPIALRFITELAQCEDLKDVELSGIGGIETWQDALEFMLLGCRNVQVTTSVMQYGYRIVEDLISGLSHFMEERGVDHLDEIVGKAVNNIIPSEELDRSFMIIPKVDEDKCVGCARCYISCYDGSHQAIEWDNKTRTPKILEDKCVGCHLCINVCPVTDCITPGDIVFKDGQSNSRSEKEIAQQLVYL
ncbi:NAD-dependent dihydropyrimidine dehydrogenase subunit PreA [Texcoconibacillus texcoconensis]|uniref:Dihydrothymine dehydrogenase n=1 Tax=Texcoconibacillus texcoconensis TaxID=1095777 RepID=A0A840QIL2_9BACI|nr:NAD-dependent dihydropyrimidine dehydrogenase subunit PreA [Texcoconibacillus texcoconensis]MBB5171959.1 dihydropyrimidine dehydrogenase (NAD+) subunit PreA [Texcoconibacillus texcoconensis]